MELKKEKNVYIVGHKNPDTDSICSAIAYARLKQQLSPEKKYVARRAGIINSETEYILNRFGVEEPALLTNVRLQVRDVDVNQVPGIGANTSIRNAWEIMKQQNVYTLAVTSNTELTGVISTGDIATSYMDVYDNRILSSANTQYANIVDTVDGELVTGNPDDFFSSGKVVVAASSPDKMEAFIEKGDLVILGNRYEVQLCAVELEASCIIVCQGDAVTRTIKKLAEDRGIVVITTPHDTFTAARMVNQSIPVRFFMKTTDLTTFTDTDYVEEIKKTMAKDRTRDFPVIDKKRNFYGFISSRRLMDASQKEVILVDHNEKSQAVDGIEEAKILEIIDHHRLGGLETAGPLHVRNQPVGCTATIIYTLYKENNVSIDKTVASLLCSAIISDTLLFRSPTCTIVDEMVAKELAAIAGLDVEELANNMFRAGSNLKGKSAEEICFQDFKSFAVGKVTIGVGQLNSMDANELTEVKGVLQPYLETAAEQNNLDMVFFLLTNIVKRSSELLYFGKGAREQIIDVFGQAHDTDPVILDGVISRKKQFIPLFVSSLQK